MRHRGRKLSYFGGCDYFRLASHPAVLEAVRDGLKKFGLNVAASRLTTGHHRLYESLEARLAEFFGAESALLVANGYATNLVVAQALAGGFSHALLDERAHPSLVDAAALLDCPVIRFKHRDADDVSRRLQTLGAATKPILLTDGMFAHDGSVAPLKAYLRLLPRDALLLVDDAHGAGVVGGTGKGSLESEGVSRRRVIQCVTLSKAFGVYGGAVLGSRWLRVKIVAASRLFIGSTPLPLPLAAAALAAVKLLQNDRRLHVRLQRNADYMKSRLRHAGWKLPNHPGPIVPLIPAGPRAAAKLKRRLLSRGIYPPFLKYPGSPPDGCFRFVISSEHSRVQLDELLSALLAAKQGEEF